MTDSINTDLKTVMRRLRLGKLLGTLPERLALARQQKTLPVSAALRRVPASR